MRSLKIRLFLILASCFFLAEINAQSFIVRGKVKDSETKAPVEGVVVRLDDSSISSASDEKGDFFLYNIPNGLRTIVLEKESYTNFSKDVEINGEDMNLGLIELTRKENAANADKDDFIPTIVLGDDDLEQDQTQSENISGVLSASRDVFVSAAAFTFGPARFRIRGYDSKYTNVLLNGVPTNDLWGGRGIWSSWGGLNDVTRNRETTIGLDATAYAFGGVGGSTNIDTRASRHRKQLRISMSASNRTYRNRLMGTWSSGVLKNGWAVSLSASRRWGNEGFIEGTFYDAWSYFLSVDKLIGDKHILNLTAFGAPSKRGRPTATVQEMYDLAGSNFYNSNWGYQNGKKRNARVSDTHQPMFILRHDWELSDVFSVTTSLSYQFGHTASSALDWYDASDPRPDYYRKLPSFIDNPQAVDVGEKLANDETWRQVRWDDFYEVNRYANATVENANGIEGNTVTGKWSQYIVEDRHYDNERLNFNMNFELRPASNFTFNAGITGQRQKTENFKIVKDLMGGEFYVNIDKFAEFDSTNNVEFIQNNLDVPNEILKEGDKWGYNYNNYTQRVGVWMQADFTGRKVDWFVSANTGETRFWREGLWRNGKFPDDSAGKSEIQSFIEYGIKVGATYKLDGRNYLFLNAGYMNVAPFIRDAFVSPRTRNQTVEGLTTEKIISIEGGYLLKAPYAKARVIGYYTRFEDKLFNRSFYLDNAIVTGDATRGGFVNYLMTGINTQHMGVELAGEVNLEGGFKVLGAAAIGQYHYTNRPEVQVYLDNVAEEVGSADAYINNYKIAGTPQSAYTLGLNYSAPKFWFATLNFNYLHRMFIEINPARRTEDAISYVDDPSNQQEIVDPGSDLWHEILDQEQAPGAFTIDFFGGKSWRINDFYIYLNVGVSNILDKRDFITGGYEQFRFDFEGKDVSRFPNRYFYGFGRNYFVNLAFRI